MHSCEEYTIYLVIYIIYLIVVREDLRGVELLHSILLIFNCLFRKQKILYACIIKSSCFQYSFLPSTIITSCVISSCTKDLRKRG